ncbi:hypothetical protein C8R44DRAFT_986884 [Mycena epipterygia]|nr:hypothetical protein C8R44DRAFT_986884 [Mycena epipterygia]
MPVGGQDLNPPEYLKYPLNGCSDTSTVVVFDGSPDCSTASSINDTTVWRNATGSTVVSVTAGLDQTTSYTVTQESCIGLNAAISATVGVPDVDSVTGSVSMDVSFTNSQDIATSSTENHLQCYPIVVFRFSPTQSIVGVSKFGHTVAHFRELRNNNILVRALYDRPLPTINSGNQPSSTSSGLQAPTSTAASSETTPLAHVLHRPH